MISLTDTELQTVMAAAAPLQPHQRSQFLRDVAAELARHPEIGAGLIGRVVREVQREHLNPSRLHHHGVSKFGW
ncbi:hypothetical protein [Bradyrhizobium cytisi]|uniref:Uncharacterized protein n=1 Tax=Bradyrhizobium cytisi TaxID=515489 RepID=A0A5S4WVS5_9BRAD|nr:hypothetical protein [Bradyrhizobium cytisi]TYL85713.1 hypothetical protein FXB38_09145 [Bradyrhizobium cytisi]